MPPLEKCAVGEDEPKPTRELLPAEIVAFAIWFAEAFLCFLHSSARLVGALLRASGLAGRDGSGWRACLASRRRTSVCL